MRIDREAIAATMFSYEHNEPWSESTAPARSHYLELADLIISVISGSDPAPIQHRSGSYEDGWQAGYAEGRDENPFYCPTCGSCGDDGCGCTRKCLYGEHSEIAADLAAAIEPFALEIFPDLDDQAPIEVMTWRAYEHRAARAALDAYRGRKA